MQLTGPSRLRPQGQGQTRLRPTSSRTGHRLAPARTGVVLHAEPNQLGDVELLNYAELIKEIEERKKQQADLLAKLDQLVVEHGIQPDASAATPPGAQQASSAGRLRPPPPPAQRRPESPRPPPVMQPQQPQPQQQQQQQPPQQQQQPQQPPAWTPAPAPVPAPAPAAPTPPPQPAAQTPQPSYRAADAAVPAPPQEPPLAGENVMNVVMVGAECAPWSKTGGLGDVMGALPKALARRGHRVMVIAPRYANYEDAWETGVRHMMRVANTDVEVGYFHAFRDGVDFVFVDHPAFHVGADIYGGGREALQFRCTLLCKAALEAVWHVAPGGIPYGDNNTVYIANDWHTALLPVYLQAHYRDYGQMTYARAVFVIHNMAHQGRAPFVESASLELPEHYREQLRLYDPIGGEHMNIMKGGLQNAHRIVAVSDGYAWECQTQEGGWGLDAIVRDNNWKLRGIVNGIDYKEWSPTNDPHLTSDGYTQYDISNLKEGKARCKAALQKELGLPVNPDAPLLGFIGRLDYQKGVDLIRDSFEWIIGQGCQLILLGSGREDLEGDLRSMEERRKDGCRAWVGFSVAMAHRITAGCDILLMPSRFEPCGLNQLYAMAYGTVPVVHAVGGLRDTVKPYDPHSDSGTGWTFERAEQSQMNSAIHNAVYTYREHRPAFERLQQRGMQQDLSWDHAAELYEQVLVAAKYQW